MSKKALQRTEIVAEVATSTGLPKAKVDAVLASFFDTAQAALSKGRGVKIFGYLNLQPVNRKARKGHNPSTGAAIDIPARKSVKAKAGAKLVNALNSK